MQSRKRSFWEALVNQVVGFFISILAYEVVMPLMGFQTSFKQNVQFVLIFTTISVVRSYVIRRFFNLGERHGHPYPPESR